LLAGRATYDLVRIGSHFEIYRRLIWHIEAPRRHPVLASHSCRAAPLDPDLACQLPFRSPASSTPAFVEEVLF
jgi:hypothetical protein